MRSWDLSVTASIGRAEIQDHFAEGKRGSCVEGCLVA